MPTLTVDLETIACDVALAPPVDGLALSPGNGVRGRRRVPATGRAVDRVLRVIEFPPRGRAMTGVELTRISRLTKPPGVASTSTSPVGTLRSHSLV
jgi:hypothetical protein